MRDEELTGETIARRQKELKDREAKALNGGGEDTRPCEKAPYPDAPIAPIMQLLDERLSTNEHEPPMRNIMGQMSWRPRAARPGLKILSCRCSQSMTKQAS